MSAREAVMQALLVRVGQYGIFRRFGRRLLPWGTVDDQPALFLRHVADQYPPRPTGLPAKVVMECEAWLYSQGGADPDVPPEISINDLLDVVEASLRPPTPGSAQTLGGLVAHAWIEGTIEIHPGDLNGQAIAIVPIRVLVPVLNGA